MRTAHDARADLILGGPHAPSASGTRYHNSVYLVRDGPAARYDNRLVPFAEETGWPAATTDHSPGQEFVRRLHLRPAPCCALRRCSWTARAPAQGAEVLPTSRTMPGRPSRTRAPPARYRDLRAVENRRYLVRAASTGFSAVIDPHGRTLAQSEFATHAVLNSTVRASRARTPYQRWGDALAWMVIAGVAVSSLRALVNRTDRNNRRSA
jgi:apolipoprotein N-acyltransferase